MPELSRALSIVDFVKFAKQGVLFGNPDMYSLPTRSEQQWLLTYLPRGMKDDTGLAKSLVTSDGRKARISVQMADLSTPKMRVLTDKVKHLVEEVFPGRKLRGQYYGCLDQIHSFHHLPHQQLDSFVGTGGSGHLHHHGAAFHELEEWF
jgi:hypothetical protein